MNKQKKLHISIFALLLCSINTSAQDTNPSIGNTNDYIISANVSFERSGVDTYESPENFQFVNNFGISISKKISKRLWIEINPQFIKNKTTLGLVRFNYFREYPFVSENIRISLNLEMHVKSFYFTSGPFCDFLLDIRSGSNSNFDEYKVNSFGYGVGAAAGMENHIYKSLFLFVELRYNQILSASLYPKNNQSYKGRFVNYGFNIGLNIHL